MSYINKMDTGICNLFFSQLQGIYKIRNNIYIYFFPVVLRPNTSKGLLILEVSRSRTTTHQSRQDSSGRVTSPSQRPLLDNTQHSQQTNIHAPGGIRTHDLSRRAAADLRLRPRGHWQRLSFITKYNFRCLRKQALFYIRT